MSYVLYDINDNVAPMSNSLCDNCLRLQFAYKPELLPAIDLSWWPSWCLLSFQNILQWNGFQNRIWNKCVSACQHDLCYFEADLTVLVFAFSICLRSYQDPILLWSLLSIYSQWMFSVLKVSQRHFSYNSVLLCAFVPLCWKPKVLLHDEQHLRLTGLTCFTLKSMSE